MNEIIWSVGSECKKKKKYEFILEFRRTKKHTHTFRPASLIRFFIIANAAKREKSIILN